MRIVLFFILFSGGLSAKSSFDLRDQKFVTPPKEQSWGTCWAFATVASLESNLLVEKSWTFPFAPDFSEYHMDKYSGFSRNGHQDHLQEGYYSGQGEGFVGSNTDKPNEGLIVHLGGDYKIATAYLSNTGGAVEEHKTPAIGSAHNDHEKFGNLPTEGVLLKNNYDHFLPSSIEWLTHGSFEENIERIKESILKYGSVGSAQYMQDDPHEVTLSGEEVHFYHGYEEPTHAINLIGWDDEQVIIPFLPGVWKIQDSDHTDEITGHIGYFITPYADTHTGQHVEFGGVSFRGTKERAFFKIHSFALHGWQYEFKAPKVSNIYSLKGEVPTHVGIYTTVPNDQVVSFVTDLDGNMLCHSQKVIKENPGFYLLTLRCQDDAFRNAKYRVEVETASGNHAHDGEKVYRPLLGSSELPEWGEPIKVGSRALENQSFYLKGGEWKDLFNYSWSEETQYGISVRKTRTANFSINLYTRSKP